MLTTTVKGIADVQKKLKQLEPKVAKKILRQTLRNMCKTIQAAAKANAPVDTGRIKKAIKVRAGKRKKNTIRLNVQIGDKDFVGKSFYGAFQEFGYKRGARKKREFDLETRTLTIKQRGKKAYTLKKTRKVWKENRKQVEGKHFMKKAFDAVAQQAMDKALQDLKQIIEQEAGK